MQTTRFNINNICLLLTAFVVYSGTSFFSKSASLHEFLSLPYILYFGGVLACMGTYAILWQKVLTFMPLNKAFLFKSVTLLMVLAISALCFGETVTIKNLIGAAFIIIGLVILSWKE